MLRKVFLILIIIFSLSDEIFGQSFYIDNYALCDTLGTLLSERTGVRGIVGIDKIMQRGNALDIYFSKSIADFPLRPDDVLWLKSEVGGLIENEYERVRIGELYCGKKQLAKFAFEEIENEGRAVASEYSRIKAPAMSHPLVSKKNAPVFDKGMEGRHIALWHSHGRYFEKKTDRWEWQRAPTFRTVEDLFTSSFVLPFLIPMLENAGAYVMTPRERDIQPHEVVADNDKAFEGERTGMLRKKGNYLETGKWAEAGTGFADSLMYYSEYDNPFVMGTARKAACISYKQRAKRSTARWFATVPKRGLYAVYVSYKSLENSTEAAHYTVKHLGGMSEFIVNQRMGGGTWVYLGTFEFGENKEGAVILDNVCPAERRFVRGSVVTADGVRFGGGVGKAVRGERTADRSTSGLPCFAEGALYTMLRSGLDTTTTSQWETEYIQDYAARGAWVNLMTESKGIPLDLSLAFHSDSGATPNDSIIGTLAIYSGAADGKDKFTNGEDRMLSRQLSDYVQTQIIKDIRAEFAPSWTRRAIRDRAYSETKTPEIPAMLLESLSHQNFADMKYGLDPGFRFSFSRAIYKGILKFLSSRYKIRYAVQPLPVNSFAAEFSKTHKDLVKLSWKPSIDTLEQTASPKGYILYTRIDGGAFNNGAEIKKTHTENGIISTEIKITPGHIYSFKIEAYNHGGKSFPSEILSIGIPKEDKGRIMIINNFYRISAPTWLDGDRYAGFDDDSDSGMPYINEINFIGKQYQKRRDQKWLDDDCPGFGASYIHYAGKKVAGNTFDFPYMHGKALFDLGYSFYSVSNGAFSRSPSIGDSSFAADIICGKQVRTKIGKGEKVPRFEVFTEAFQEALRTYTNKGGNIIISGAYIGTDVWSDVYPLDTDEKTREKTKQFVENVLGYKWLTNYASATAEVKVYDNQHLDTQAFPKTFKYCNIVNDSIYHIEAPDGIVPADNNGSVFLRYRDTDIPASVCYNGNGYKVISYGFPLETICSDFLFSDVLKASILFFIPEKN